MRVTNTITVYPEHRDTVTDVLNAIHAEGNDRTVAVEIITPEGDIYTRTLRHSEEENDG